MIRCDAIVVGGGPAGSSCARKLRLAGWRVIVVDRARFPRDKVCAGWLTPDVFPLLDLDPAEYRSTGATLQEITGFRTRVIGGTPVETRYPRTVSYAIRRCEFDHFLLGRAGAQVIDDSPVTSIRRRGDTWVVNDRLESPVLVGAGGHFCPVARHLRGGTDTATPVVAKEAEFLLRRGEAGVNPELPELLFCRDLQGYGWCVRKGNYLNVGIGRRGGRDFNQHVRHFMDLLGATMHVEQSGEVHWRGHAYLAAGAGPRPLVGPGVLLVGDAAGLAYPESGEGIKPAIESATLAASTLIATPRLSADALQPYAAAIARLHPPRPQGARRTDRLAAAVGRALLGSSLFTRHVVLDRWFLRLQRRGSGLGARGSEEPVILRGNQ
jgi:geranylgeranyl reductase family protein